MLFGKGTDRVDLALVLIHELGHWIGLRHLPETSVMSEVIQDAKCVDQNTVERLSQVIVGPWRPDGHHALLYRR